MLALRGMRRLAAFPSVTWFQRLAEARAVHGSMDDGPLDLTLVVRVIYPEGHDRLIAIEFGGGCRVSVTAPADLADVGGPHPVVLEGAHHVWREMIEAIRAHRGADPAHTLDHLTHRDARLRVLALDAADGQRAVERFHHHQASLQAFFDEAAAIETAFAA